MLRGTPRFPYVVRSDSGSAHVMEGEVTSVGLLSNRTEISPSIAVLYMRKIIKALLCRGALLHGRVKSYDALIT